MRILLLLFFIPFFYSCKKANKASVAVQISPEEATELLNPDDNFSEKKSGKGKMKDSIETSIVAFNDLNKDGSFDTAFLVYNNLSHHTTIQFSGISGQIVEKSGSSIWLKDIGDLNGDGNNEIMMTLQADESCWDEVKLYSYLNSTWVEKYNGLTYQCAESNSYQFIKIDDKTVKFVTYGINKDSIDQEIGDTLENIIPNGRLENLISW